MTYQEAIIPLSPITRELVIPVCYRCGALGIHTVAHDACHERHK